jgi:hypothetical protein
MIDISDFIKKNKVSEFYLKYVGPETKINPKNKKEYFVPKFEMSNKITESDYKIATKAVDEIRNFEDFIKIQRKEINKDEFNDLFEEPKKELKIEENKTKQIEEKKEEKF